MKECIYCGATADYICDGGCCECGMEWVDGQVDDMNYITENSRRGMNESIDYRLNNIDIALESKR